MIAQLAAMACRRLFVTRATNSCVYPFIRVAGVDEPRRRYRFPCDGATVLNHKSELYLHTRACYRIGVQPSHKCGETLLNDK